ncbi:hypothetical protein RRG08_045189, partial [Elysia crispata]
VCYNRKLGCDHISPGPRNPTERLCEPDTLEFVDGLYRDVLNRSTTADHFAVTNYQFFSRLAQPRGIFMRDSGLSPSEDGITKIETSTQIHGVPPSDVLNKLAEFPCLSSSRTSTRLNHLQQEASIHSHQTNLVISDRVRAQFSPNSLERQSVTVMAQCHGSGLHFGYMMLLSWLRSTCWLHDVTVMAQVYMRPHESPSDPRKDKLFDFAPL